MYNNISLYFSSDCNMACQYCEVNKHKPCMAANNRIIRQKIETGEYVKNVIARLGHLKMNEISLWGMEPTINADLFEKLIDPLLCHFVDVNTIMFSTNSWLGWNRIKLFILALQKFNAENNRAVNLSLQMSLDGDAWINDKSRKQGTTVNTLKTIRDVVDYTPKDLNYNLRITTKPTLDVEYMRMLNGDSDLLHGYFQFFDKLQSDMLARNKNNHIKLELNQRPTLVNPGHHTVEDGRTFAEFIHNISLIDDSQFEYMKHPLIIQPLRGILDGLKINNHVNYSHWGVCSAGRYTANIDCNGNLFSCHALFSRSYIGKDSVITAAHTTVQEDDASRLQYVDLLWQEYPESRRKFCEVIIDSLASYGQIDKCYLTDKRMKKLLFYALGGVYCHYGHIDTTKSIWAFTTSQLKYFGNGAVQEILRYIDQCELVVKKTK